MTELEALRKKIDEIDSQLLPLFLERMECTSGVAEYKRKNNMPVLDRKREQEVLQNKVSRVDGELAASVYNFYSAIMAISRAAQKKSLGRKTAEIDLPEHFAAHEFKKNPTVVYQGVAGAYSETALMKFFGGDTKRTAVMTFAEVFDVLKEGRADYGVLPLENSYTGSISDVYDLLAENSFYIVGEVDVPIEHCLVGLHGAKLSDIRTVYSHEQGFMQCKSFFRDMPEIEFRPYFNTAVSAKTVAESGDKTCAAIAGKRTAELYGLEVLAENINQSAKNTTRFAVVAPKGIINEGCGKVSIAFTLPNESGALSRTLSLLAANGLNMVKIESRPRHDRNFEYMFFVDFEGNLLDSRTRHITEEIRDQTSDFRILGNYAVAGQPEV